MHVISDPHCSAVSTGRTLDAKFVISDDVDDDEASRNTDAGPRNSVSCEP